MAYDIAIVEKSISRREDGEPVTTSQHIAATFGKRHADVLRDIKVLDISDDFNRRNFALVEYKDQKGEIRPVYEITKNGFMFLAMGYKGEKAARLKELWIDAFDGMYVAVESQAAKIDELSSLLVKRMLREEVLKKKILALSPYWERIYRYKERDLTHDETAMLIGKTPGFVYRSLKNMKALDIVPGNIRRDLKAVQKQLDRHLVVSPGGAA